jgi:hypothetical protein
MLRNFWIKLLFIAVIAPIAASSSAEAATRRFTALVTSVQTSAPTPSPRCAAPRVLVTFAGNAIATLFGRASVHHSHCIIDDPADPTIINGEMVIDGARGDLVLRYSGMDTGGELEGTFTIVGGTGAFARASGEGTFTGFGVPEEERGFIVMRGRLTLP